METVSVLSPQEHFLIPHGKAFYTHLCPPTPSFFCLHPPPFLSSQFLLPSLTITPHPPTHLFFLAVNQTGVLAHSLPNSYAFTEINRAVGDGRRTGEKQAGGKQRDREEGEGKGGTVTTKLLHSRYMIIFATVCQHACMI